MRARGSVPNNVLVLQLSEEGDLTQCRARDAFILTVQADPFKRYKLPRTRPLRLDLGLGGPKAVTMQ